MRSVIRLLIVLLAVTALPLRGYATVAAGLCDQHHGGMAGAHEVALAHPDHAGGDRHGSDAESPDPVPLAPVCSLCASCCGGATLALDPLHGVTPAPSGAQPIPFDGRVAPGHVPEALVRPPLAL
jgi:hypothetical protein